jgi:hypothetical protein
MSSEFQQHCWFRAVDHSRGTQFANNLSVSGFQRLANAIGLKADFQRKRVPMNTNTNKNIQRVIEFSGALVLVGVGLNILVMQTLGTFDAAAVILGLFIGFWAFVLGNLVLIPSSIWLFIRKAHTVSEPVSANRAEAHAPVGLRLCH